MLLNFFGTVTGGQGQNRTADTRIFSPLLYRLSYLAGKRRALNRKPLPASSISARFDSCLSRDSAVVCFSVFGWLNGVLVDPLVVIVVQFRPNSRKRAFVLLENGDRLPRMWPGGAASTAACASISQGVAAGA